MSDHQSVLVDEVRNGLVLEGDGCYVDATYGRGGHSSAMLESLTAGARLLAIDRDPVAVADARIQFANDSRFTICHANFAALSQTVATWLGGRRLAGILFDLGVSSPQLDTADRGFSFVADGPLDMRMDTTTGTTAAQWLAKVSQEELGRVIATYGEQPGAHRIAAAIVRERQQQPLLRTNQLAELIAATAPRSARRQHPATRVFQAIRIAINDELGALKSALSQAVDLLGVGGRLCVISFHSLEDRIVKRFIAEQSRGDAAYAGLPLDHTPLDAQPTIRPIGRLIRPSDDEIQRNPRARSARLRVAERLVQGAAA